MSYILEINQIYFSSSIKDFIHDKAKYFEFESSNTEKKESVKLLFSLDEKEEEKDEYLSCYSSELLVQDKKCSINYLIAV